MQTNFVYRKISDISRTLLGNKLVDHSDVVGTSPVLTLHLAPMDWTKPIARRGEKHLCLGIGCVLY